MLSLIAISRFVAYRYEVSGPANPLYRRYDSMRPKRSFVRKAQLKAFAAFFCVDTDIASLFN
jgi:hypothetical protein